MKKFLFILFGVFVVMGAFAAGENTPTSKSYVDAAVAQKQDKISANIIMPAGYTRLAYIESTGTQWIDTGYKPNNLTNFEIQYLHIEWLSSTVANIPYGCTNNPEVGRANNGLFRTNRGGNGLLYNGVAWGNTNAGTNINLPNQFLAELNEWYTDKYLQNKIYINGTLVATSNAPADISWNSSRTMYLFRRNASAPMPSKIRISYAKIWENESVIKNFIPARRNSDGEIGMYDTISGQFFTNSGTGTFIAGPIIPGNQVLTNTGTAGEYGTKGIYDTNGGYAVQQNNLVDAATMNAAVQNAIDSEFQCIEWLDPNDHTSDCLLLQLGGITQVPAGYTQLEYIESTGTQWIDTGYKPNNLTNFEIQYLHIEWLSSTVANIPYGCTNNPEVGRANNGLFRTNRGKDYYNRAAWGNTNAGTNIDLPNQFLAKLNEWYTDKYLQNKIYINGTLVATSNAPADISWNSSRTMYLFMRNASAPMPSKIRISYAKIWENESVIKNFIPARRNSDGVLGMYDTVSNTFFTNAGTGEFIAGPVVNLYLPTGE